MDNTPTAEKLVKNIISECNLEPYEVAEWNPELIPSLTNDVKNIIIFHVEAALKAAIKNVKLDRPDGSGGYFGVDKESILNSYPLTNIK